MIQDEDVRCVEGDKTDDGSVKGGGVVNEVITCERYVRRGETRQVRITGCSTNRVLVA